MYASYYVDFYLENGINILPIDSGVKHPKYSWKEYQETTYEKPEILRVHEGNFFVICGKISDNLKILDIETWDVYEKYFLDVDSFTIKTPHGGVHIYYKYNDDLTRIASVNGWPVEVRGDGHGCTSADSMVEGKYYEVIKESPIINQDLSKLAHERLLKLSEDRNDDIRTWKKKIDISTVIAQTVEMKSKNKGCWMGICPFHNDTNPSLAVYEDNYYCYGCREHGDVIDWVVKRDNIGFKEAVDKLHKEFGTNAPKQGKRPKSDPLNWSSGVKIGDRKFEVQCVDGTILVDHFDITEFVKDSSTKTHVTDAMRKRISEAHKQLNVDDLVWAELVREVKDLVHKRNVKSNPIINKGKKSPEECPFVIIKYDYSGDMNINPNAEMIAIYLMNKFDLMAISDEKQVEGLELWIRTDNEYRQLPKSDTFLIKELQTALEEYDLSEHVNPKWINRVEILRQSKVKRIVQPVKGMFPVANGILDIDKMELLTEDNGKICLVRSGVVYDPDAKCPEFDKSLNDIFNSNKIKIEAFLSWIGAIIAGRNPQIIIMFKSRGRSGKGVLMTILAILFGNMITMMSPNKLHDRFSNWGFLHRRLVYLEEHDGKDATIKAMKELSGGSSCVSFETKGVQAIMQAEVQCAIIINTNNPPPFEKGSAWEERFKLLDFPNSYVDCPKEPWERQIDYGIKDRLMKELPGVLNKFLPYAKYALHHPEKMFPQDIAYKDIEESLDKSTDSLDSFINECCELAPIESDFYNNMKTQYKGYSVTDTTFMKRYEEYCSRSDVNIRATAKLYVKKALKKDYRVITNGHDLMGIRLKETKTEPPDKSSANFANYIATAEEGA